MILSHEEIIQRLVYPLINEATRCLDEGIAEKADDVDLAMVFGTGFAPFRGGPLRYADSVGVPKIVQTLDRLAASAPRFTPCDRLRKMATANERFHPADV
jgi:3-hydroxyacyl-CoA dehydrogenase